MVLTNFMFTRSFNYCKPGAQLLHLNHVQVAETEQKKDSYKSIIHDILPSNLMISPPFPTELSGT